MSMSYFYVVRTKEPNKQGVYKYFKKVPSYFGKGKTTLALGMVSPENACKYGLKEDALYDIENYLRDHRGTKISDLVIANVEVKVRETKEENPLPKYIQFNCNAYGWDADNLKTEDIRDAIFERYHINAKTFSYNVITNSFDNHKTVRVLSDSLVLEEE